MCVCVCVCARARYALTVQGVVTDMLQENVVQPLLVSMSAIRLASECVRSILKIDDVVGDTGIGWQWWMAPPDLPLSVFCAG